MAKTAKVQIGCTKRVQKRELPKREQQLVREAIRIIAKHVDDSESGYIYVVEAVGIDRFKIGASKGLHGRVEGIQTTCPVPAKLRLWLHGGFKLEGKLHRLFDRFRCNGEWFEACPALRQFVEDALPFQRDCERLRSPKRAPGVDCVEEQLAAERRGKRLAFPDLNWVSISMKSNPRMWSIS
jgi:hypothetical protein